MRDCPGSAAAGDGQAAAVAHAAGLVAHAVGPGASSAQVAALVDGVAKPRQASTSEVWTSTLKANIQVAIYQSIYPSIYLSI